MTFKDITVDFSSYAVTPAEPETPPTDTTVLTSQWQEGSDGLFTACGRTTKSIPPGNYFLRGGDGMVFLKLKDLEVDNVIELPGAKSDEVLADIERFWDSRELYEKHGVLYKRGILLYGPQGSGKTVTIKRVSDAVIARNGVVLHSGWPSQISTMIEMVRSVEPDRPIVAVIEDIDTCIAHGQEANLLSLLDGEGSVTNIVYIGTTNYPDKLPPRVVNRPSRFDERIMIDMPSLSAREAYLRRITNNNPECDKWAKDTDGFSIAHLKELVVAIHCLHKPYEDTLVRLYAMRNKVPMIAGFNPTPDEEDEDL